MLVDILMPHMRGFESIRVFHEIAPTVPLIANARVCVREYRRLRPSGNSSFTVRAARTRAARQMRDVLRMHHRLRVI
jgi:hypothetical protein